MNNEWADQREKDQWKMKNNEQWMMWCTGEEAITAWSMETAAEATVSSDEENAEIYWSFKC